MPPFILTTREGNMAANHGDERTNGGGVLPRTSRRGFLKGMGLAAGAAVAAGGVLPSKVHAQQSDEEPKIPGLRELGRGEREITLRINGQERRVTVEPRTTLLDALRLPLDMTGAKQVCDRGACGACSVLLDGRAVNSCLYLAIDAVGHEVTTAEGISADPRFAPLVDSFCDHDAAQCGYCIPGFLVRGADLMLNQPSLSPGEVKRALSGNLCRCGTHVMIHDAVAEVVAKGVAS